MSGDKKGNYKGMDWRITENHVLILGNGEKQSFKNNDETCAEDYPWYQYRGDVDAIKVDGIIYAEGSMKEMFAKQTAKDIDLTGFETSNVTDMSFLFLKCENLTNLNIKNFEGLSLKQPYGTLGMFGGCTNLSWDYRNHVEVLNSPKIVIPKDSVFEFHDDEINWDFIYDREDIDDHTYPFSESSFEKCSVVRGRNPLCEKNTLYYYFNEEGKLEKPKTETYAFFKPGENKAEFVLRSFYERFNETVYVSRDYYLDEDCIYPNLIEARHNGEGEIRTYESVYLDGCKEKYVENEECSLINESFAQYLKNNSNQMKSHEFNPMNEFEKKMEENKNSKITKPKTIDDIINNSKEKMERDRMEKDSNKNQDDREDNTSNRQTKENNSHDNDAR